MKNIETEKKFLVTSDEWRINSKGFKFRQGYLSLDPGRTVRIRLEDEKGKLNIKGEKKMGSGDEFEYDIPKDEALYLIEHLCIKPIIEKTRYKINYKDHLWEVDEFGGENAGLILAEIELESIDQHFEKPPWIGKDVTHDPKYKNASLVKNPFIKW
jgi:adenylate cyclase